MAFETLLCLCGAAGAAEGVLSAGGGGKPGVGIASKGTLVGGRRRSATDVLDEDCEELSRLVGDGASFEFRPARLGLGAAEMRGLARGDGCMLKIPSRPIFAGVE